MTGLEIKKLIYTLSKSKCVDIVYLKPEAFESLCLYLTESKIFKVGTRSIPIVNGDLKVWNIRVRKS